MDALFEIYMPCRFIHPKRTMKTAAITLVILVQTMANVPEPHTKQIIPDDNDCLKENLISPLDMVPYKPEVCRDKDGIAIRIEQYSRVPKMTVCPIKCRISDGHISGFKTCIDGQWKGNAQCDEQPNRRKKRWWWSDDSPSPPPPDTTPPILNCPPNIAVTVSQILQRSTSVTWTEPVANDDRDGVIYPSRSGLGPGSTFHEGLSRVDYTARDSAGNTAICSLSILVNVVRCLSPQYGSPGTLSCSPSDLIAGASCSFYCTETGYEIVGSSYTTCIISGAWSNDIPKCQRITCGNPGTVNHGSAVSNGYNYGDIVRYTCDIYYNLTGVSERTCQSNRMWSGEKPSCNYVNSCGSRPCQNGATCVNKLDDYACICGPGWSGADCNQDIQPAVFRDCPESIIRHTSMATANVSWTTPLYFDPLAKNLTLFSNYPQNNWQFPWGDFTIQYNVLKESNGLWANCTFPLNVRPHECIPFGVSQHGAKLCNGWKTDYFRICLGVCLQGFGFLPTETGTQWNMCTASGHWIPVIQGYEPGQLPSCYAPYANNTLTYKGHPIPVVDNCSTSSTRISLGRFYVDSLMSDDNVKDMCIDYKDECTPENVEIRCQP